MSASGEREGIGDEKEVGTRPSLAGPKPAGARYCLYSGSVLWNPSRITRPFLST